MKYGRFVGSWLGEVGNESAYINSSPPPLTAHLPTTCTSDQSIPSYLSHNLTMQLTLAYYSFLWDRASRCATFSVRNMVWEPVLSPPCQFRAVSNLIPTSRHLFSQCTWYDLFFTYSMNFSIILKNYKIRILDISNSLI